MRLSGLIAIVPIGALCAPAMPEAIQEANVLGENADTIDLEIVFA